MIFGLNKELFKPFKKSHLLNKNDSSNYINLFEKISNNPRFFQGIQETWKLP